MSCPPSTVDSTERSWMPRFSATDATPARQAARQADEEVLDRRDAVVLRREDLGVVGFERPLLLVALLLAEAEEALDLDRAVHAVLPLGGRPPGELGGLRRTLQHFARIEQCLHVDSVVDCGHVAIPPLLISPDSLWRWLTIHRPGQVTIAPWRSQPRRSRPARLAAERSARRNAVSRPAGAGAARLRAGAAPGSGGVRDLRCPLAPAGQRHPGVPCAQRRRPRGGLREDATRREHARRVRGRRSRRLGRQGPRLVGRDDRPGKAFDTDRFFVVSTNLLGGCRGTTGPVIDRPGDRPAVRAGLPRDHRRGHGADRARVPGRHSASSGSRR